MAADEYFDAIGQVLSYVLSAEDFIHSQRNSSSGTQFWIERDGNILNFYAGPNNRYFVITYRFSLSQNIATAYEDNPELFNEHLQEFEIDDSQLSDENLYQNVALQRVENVGEEEAQKIMTDIRGLATHTDCRISSHDEPHPEESDTKIWDGVSVSGLLYPYESDFTPRDYEQTAQEVISVGNQVDETMKKLDVMREIEFTP